MSADLIVYGLVAAGLVFWLRSVLGTRHGEERERPNPLAVKVEISVESLQDPVLSAEDRIARLAQNSGPVLAIENKTAENGLLEIVKADRNFDIDAFLNAAQDAFAIIVESFAAGDRETLKDLLSESVYNAFNQALGERETRNETVKSEIHAIRRAEVTEARMQGKMAYVTVRFKAQETSVTYDSERKIISGHPEKTTEMRDIWVFGRDVKSKDPRWLVYETRGDFDGDNEVIPNA